jgi:rod shape-determining protein MreC
MLRLSVPARQALARLTLPLMLLMAAGLVLAGQADQRLGSRLRVTLDDGLAPLYNAAAGPLDALKRQGGAMGGWLDLHAANQRLRADNRKLRRWRALALALAAQNRALKSELHFIPAPKPAFFTARVIADAGGLYRRSLLVAVPRDGARVADAVAMDGRGLVGRVVEAGQRSARILLITDINSRVPVSIGARGERALMVGTNTGRPNLVYWPSGAPPREGMVVVTSAIGGVFPSGLPIGTVDYAGGNRPMVLPFAGLDRLRMVRLFEYRHIGTALSGAKERLPGHRAPASGPVGRG